MSIDGESLAEETVEDVDRSSSFAGAERVWAHVWFALITLGLGFIPLLGYFLIQTGHIQLDVMFTGSLNVAGPLKLFLYGLVSLVLFYTWQNYVRVAGKENAEGIVSAVFRVVAVIADNYQLDRVEKAVEKANEESDEKNG